MTPEEIALRTADALDGEWDDDRCVYWGATAQGNYLTFTIQDAETGAESKFRLTVEAVPND